MSIFADFLFEFWTYDATKTVMCRTDTTNNNANNKHTQTRN